MASINNRGVSVITKEPDIRNMHANVLNSYLIKKDHDSNIFPEIKIIRQNVLSCVTTFLLSKADFACGNNCFQ